MFKSSSLNSRRRQGKEQIRTLPLMGSVPLGKLLNLSEARSLPGKAERIPSHLLFRVVGDRKELIPMNRLGSAGPSAGDSQGYLTPHTHLYLKKKKCRFGDYRALVLMGRIPEGTVV